MRMNSPVRSDVLQSRRATSKGLPGHSRRAWFVVAFTACFVSFGGQLVPAANAAEMPSSAGTTEEERLAGDGDRLAGGGDRFAGHLAAGEYRQARELAMAAESPAVRDNLLDRLAQDQARRGVISRAVETAAYMHSDRARSRTLSHFRQPFQDDFSPRGGRGGGIVADFDSLINLITNTVAVDSWEEVGGPGTIEPFAAGVHVDPAGTLRKVERLGEDDWLGRLRLRAARPGENSDLRRSSDLRLVSLNRLEREVQLRAAEGLSPTPGMQYLAGLYRVDYLFLYPETGDVVLAGPAGDWRWDEEGRAVNIDSGRPLLRLDDLVACLRSVQSTGGVFGCSIDPTAENLQATQRFLRESKLQGAAWREGLRETLGLQNITLHGIDPRSHAAHVLVEADYRMKRVGIGLEEGVLGVESYLDLIKLDENGNPPPMDVVRWWFAMDYEAVYTSAAQDAFRFTGPGVRVLSESEFLAEDGERVRRGKSTAPTAQFAEAFTRHFEELAQKYPVYAELRQVFDLALVASLIEAHGWRSQIDWHLTYFGAPDDDSSFVFPTAIAEAPQQVATVMNHRDVTVRRRGRRLRHTIVAVSGGVVGDTRQYSHPERIEQDAEANSTFAAQRHRPGQLPPRAWWWD